jgi:hypothetical protein
MFLHAPPSQICRDYDWRRQAAGWTGWHGSAQLGLHLTFLLMLKTSVIALCIIALTACTANGEPARVKKEGATRQVALAQPAGSIAPLSAAQREELTRAVDEMAVKGGAAPECIRRLQPVEVYHDRGNVVIALRRSLRKQQGRQVCYEERGYVVQPAVSSYRPTNNEHWTFKPLDSAIFEYVWKK